MDTWIQKLTSLFEEGKAFSQREVREYFEQIARSFAEVKRRDVEKIKVGVVGEIYVKYSPLANNGLEQFLFEQDCEVMVPGILSFMIFKVDNRLEDIQLYGGSQAKKQVCTLLKWYFTKYETDLIAAVKKFPQFTAPAPYSHLKELAGKVIGYGCKMGEGWLLTAEAMELVESGYGNVVCAQPFGCLPNHIVGKGMIRKVKKLYPPGQYRPHRLRPQRHPGQPGKPHQADAGRGKGAPAGQGGIPEPRRGCRSGPGIGLLPAGQRPQTAPPLTISFGAPTRA